MTALIKAKTDISYIWDKFFIHPIIVSGLLKKGRPFYIKTATINIVAVSFEIKYRLL